MGVKDQHFLVESMLAREALRRVVRAGHQRGLARLLGDKGDSRSSVSDCADFFPWGRFARMT